MAIVFARLGRWKLHSSNIGNDGRDLLLGYGSFFKLAPLGFGRVVGLYIATLFVVWQVFNVIALRSFPTMPILVGGGSLQTGPQT
jgi:hypothetical protein